jgi:hypothetical protein
MDGKCISGVSDFEYTLEGSMEKRMLTRKEIRLAKGKQGTRVKEGHLRMLRQERAEWATNNRDPPMNGGQMRRAQSWVVREWK